MAKRILCALLAALMLAACCSCEREGGPVDPDGWLESQQNGGSAGTTEQSADKKLSFETEDVDGNTVSSSELFGTHKVTMVNIWTSWCGYCVMEMPELEEMNAELAQKDAAIVGLLYDAYEPGGLEDGLAAINDTGVTYVNLKPWDSCFEDLPVQAFPTTIFVDSEGNVLNIGPVIGADTRAYRSVMSKLLDEE